MAVLNRKLFNNQLYQSKGTGIATGLDAEDNRLNQLFEQQQRSQYCQNMQSSQLLTWRQHLVNY